MYRTSLRVVGPLALSLLAWFCPSGHAAGTLPGLQKDFEQYSGARLVFNPTELPPGHYYDRMPALTGTGQQRAAEIAFSEVRKLPPGYLGSIGLKTIGIFRACVSKQGDGFRPYDAQLQGYRYYGIWNGSNAIAAASYSDEQLALTLQHEIFHHVDSTLHGRTDAQANAFQDHRFLQIQQDKQVYKAAAVKAEDLAELQKRGRGAVLEAAVSHYARKTLLEDKAETARYLMSHLADALAQAATRPQLSGSQRMLHVLTKYEQALPEGGPGLNWFVGVALGRPLDPPVMRTVPPPLKPDNKPLTAAELAERMQSLASGAAASFSRDQARDLLRQAAALDRAKLAPEEARELARSAAALGDRLLRQRIQPHDKDTAFAIWGKEDAHGINQTLRADVAAFGVDAGRVGNLLVPGVAEESVAALQLQGLRLFARYYRFIHSRWSVTTETRQLFEQARDQMILALPEKTRTALREATTLDWATLAERITAEGKLARVNDAPAEVKPPTGRRNTYLAKVDAAIANPEVRAAIRRVQPACVRLGNGSGVCLTPEGHILTAAHVVDKMGAQVVATFPDGNRFTATCVAIDTYLDLAICTVSAGEPLPFASLAPDAPSVGDRIVCIGQPGRSTPRGQPTGYQPFQVSTGKIRGFMDNPLGNQTLGRTKHDAWTYWGHSGSPLFNEAGRIVALHNSWDSETAMRHAVTYQAIVQFLKKAKVVYRTEE